MKVLKKERQYYWVDIESGITFPCSKEFYNNMINLWQICKPNLSNSKVGSILFFGTSGNI